MANIKRHQMELHKAEIRKCCAKDDIQTIKPQPWKGTFLYQKLIHRRTVRYTAENKTGPKIKVNPNDTLKLKTFTHNIVNIYNSLPPYLTKMRNYTLFKKWIKIFESNQNHNTRPKTNPDNLRTNFTSTDISC